MATRFVKKYLDRIKQNGLPFDYVIKFVRETTDDENPQYVSAKEFDTFESLDDTMFVDIIIKKENCENKSLLYDYHECVLFKFPSAYPFCPP